MSYISSTSPDLQCQAVTRRGHRCANIPSGRSEKGLSLCVMHLRKSHDSVIFVDVAAGDNCEPPVSKPL